MTLVYNDKYNQYLKENKYESDGCSVCFNNKDRYYGICRHCSLGVCLDKNCVEIYPHINNSEFLICKDCEIIINKKLKPVDYIEEDSYLENFEKDQQKKLMLKAEKKRLAYIEILNMLNSFKLK